MSDTILENGTIVPINGVDFEITSASYSEDETGDKYRLSYNLRPFADVEAERQAEIEHQAELARLEKEAKESELDAA